MSKVIYFLFVIILSVICNCSVPDDNKTASGDETDIINKPASGNETDIINEPDSGNDADIINKPDSGNETDTINKPDSGNDPDIINKPDSGNETDIIEKKQVELDKSEQAQRTNIIDFGRMQYIFELNKTANWFGAFNACRRKGTFLAHINSTELMKVINDYLMSLNTTQKFWIAANRLENKTKLVKLFTEEPLNYTNWAEGPPDFNKDNERCVALGLNQMSTQYFWHGLNCNDNIHYICSRKDPEKNREYGCILVNNKRVTISL